MNSKRWSKEDAEKSIAFLKNGKSYKEISKELNRTAKAIKVFLNRNGNSFLAEQKTKKKCLCCNKEFNTTIKSEKKFCNKSCSATYNNKLRKVNYNKTKSVCCIACNKEIEVNIRTPNKNCKCDACSSKKVTKNRENRRILKEKYYNLKLDNKCINCGKDLKDKNNFFCNNTCCGEFKLKQKFKEIESGNIKLSPRIYKLYLIEKHGEKCMECGWAEKNKVSNTIPIELEHVDGNSENNSLSNLKLLCPNCHSLTPTYRFLNVGNGRYKRKQRYKDGKSF